MSDQNEQDRAIGELIRKSQDANRRHAQVTDRLESHARELAKLINALRQAPANAKFAPNEHTRGLLPRNATLHYEDLLDTDAIKQTIQDFKDVSAEKADLDRQKLAQGL